MSWTSRFSERIIGLDTFAKLAAAHAARYRSLGQDETLAGAAGVNVQSNWQFAGSSCSQVFARAQFPRHI